MTDNGVYDVRPPRAPILRGVVLKLMVGVLEKPRVAAMLGPLLTRDLGVQELRAREGEAGPVFLPLHRQRDFCSGNATALEGAPTAGSRGQNFRFRTIRDFRQAYAAAS